MSLASSWCRIFEGDSQAAGALIDRAAAGLPGAAAGELEIMRAVAAFQDGDAHAAERHARRGLGQPLPSRSIECLGHLYVGRSMYAQSRWDGARVHLRRAAALADRTTAFWAVTALFWLGATDTDAGDILAGEQSMRRAQKVSSDTEIAAAGGIADTGLAFIRMIQLESDEAIDLAERGTRRLERTTFTEMVFRAYFVWSEALSLGGRFDDSHAVADEGIRWLHGRSMGGGPLEAWLWLSQHRNLMRQHRFDDASSASDVAGLADRPTSRPGASSRPRRR